MTRENKLALVVGFGLILLVGILVSDHFSAARNQEPAELSQALDPLSATRAENPELIALRAETTRPRGIDLTALDSGASNGAGFGSGFANRTENGGGGFDPAGAAKADAERWDQPEFRGRAVDPVVPDLVDGIEMGRGPDTGIGLAPAEAERLPYTFHHVRKSENLSAICKEHFGDPSLALALARYNDLANPNSIQAGQRLRIPHADDLVRGRTAADVTSESAGDRGAAPAARRRGAEPKQASPSRPAAPSTTTYTVKEGDILTEIARTLLGSSRKYLVIFEANRDQLDSADDIRPGMTLRIPKQ